MYTLYFLSFYVSYLNSAMPVSPKLLSSAAAAETSAALHLCVTSYQNSNNSYNSYNSDNSNNKHNDNSNNSYNSNSTYRDSRAYL